MTSIVTAFDVDGTLDCAGGPVEVATLQYLKAIGVTVVMVSPSGARPKGLIERTSKSRVENLKDVRAEFPGATIYLYISDNAGDDLIAKEAGFTYVHPKDFHLR